MYLLSPSWTQARWPTAPFVRYEGIVNNHLKPALGHRKLKDLARAEVKRLCTEQGKTLSTRSGDYIHVTLQKALSQAVRDDLIPAT